MRTSLRDRQHIVFALGILIAFQASGGTNMSQVKGQLIQKVPGLAGFWQFATPAGEFVGVVVNGESADSLTLFARSSRGWTAKQTIPLDGSIRASDAYVVGPDLLFCWEHNHHKALRFGKWQLQDLVSGKVVPLEVLGAMGLGEAQAKRVTPTQEWTVISMLLPRYWLFHPKWVRGEKTVVIANTADGQAMLFAPGSDKRSRPEAQRSSDGSSPRTPPMSPDLESFGIRNGLLPQAMVWQGTRLVVYKQVAGQANPFFLRSSFDGRSTSVPGDLVVQDAGGAAVNLSSQLKLGPVTSFSLTESAAHVPWIFAVRQAVAGTEVIAIARGASTWTVKASKPVDNLIQELTVWQAADGFQIVYAAKDKQGWSVWHLPWPTLSP
jgi:hypothetical protein